MRRFRIAWGASVLGVDSIVTLVDRLAPDGKGYGVYQAYRRMLREERTDHGAEYLVLYIWGDDHIRSLLRCRHALTYRFWEPRGGRAFHGNFWPNLEMDLATGRFIEKENLLPIRESLYQMFDPQRMVDLLRDDLALQLYAFKLGHIRELDRGPVDKLAARLEFPIDWSRQRDLQVQAGEFLDCYSLRATRIILENARAFAGQDGKKLLVVLFDPYRAMAEMHSGGRRYDQEVVDFLSREKFNYFDMNAVHLRDFKTYTCLAEFI